MKREISINDVNWHHTEYEEYQKLQLSTVVRYQHNNILGKISSNYRYQKKISMIDEFIYSTITQRFNCERKYWNIYIFFLPFRRLFIPFRGSVVHLISFPNTELGCGWLRKRGWGEGITMSANIVMSVSHRRWTMASSIGPTLIYISVK